MRTCLFLDRSFPSRTHTITITELGGGPVDPHRNSVVQLPVLLEEL